MSSTIYATSSSAGNLASKSALAFAFTMAIFALLPLLHLLPTLLIGSGDTQKVQTAIDIPPVVETPPQEKPKEKEKLEKPELEKPKPKLNLTQIEALLNIGPGDIGVSFTTDIANLANIREDLKIFETEELEKMPRALFQNQPVYPYDLKSQRIEGWVVLEWVITDKGRVTRIRVHSSSHSEFQRAAIESIMNSKWQPGEINGEAVNSRVRQRIEFNL